MFRYSHINANILRYTWQNNKTSIYTHQHMKQIIKLNDLKILYHSQTLLQSQQQRRLLSNIVTSSYSTTTTTSATTIMPIRSYLVSKHVGRRSMKSFSEIHVHKVKSRFEPVWKFGRDNPFIFQLVIATVKTQVADLLVQVYMIYVYSMLAMCICYMYV